MVRDWARGVASSLEAPTQGDLLLLVSELVTNAVRHSAAPAGSAIDVTISIDPDGVSARVCDEGHDPIQAPTDPGPDASSGFGLTLVDRLSARWGIDRDEQNCVWFEIPRAAAS